MRILFLCFLGLNVASAFVAPRHIVHSSYLSSLSKKNHEEKDTTVTDILCKLDTAGKSITTAATIAAAALFSTNVAVTPLPAEAVEISSGAFVIETSAIKTENLKSGLVDSQSLLKTLYFNRKELQESFRRIQGTIQDELTNRPVYSEIAKEFLTIEGDVAPSIKVLPPSDWKQLAKDISNGKLNFLLNGEVVNVAVEDSFGKEEDEITLKIKGFKGENYQYAYITGGSTWDVFSFSPSKGPIAQSLEPVFAWFDEPFLPQSMPETFQPTNGQAILLGTTSGIVATYGVSYAFYLDMKEKEEVAAEAKRKVALGKRMAAEKKKAAETK